MENESAISIKNVSCRYGTNTVLRNISLEIPARSIYAFIGPSGCGKTTMLRSINRMNDFVAGFKLTGEIEIDGENIYSSSSSVYAEKLRTRIGMIFQQPNPLPTSIIKNMTLPLEEHFKGSRVCFEEKAISKLKLASLYGEVHDRLKKPATALSGGQQQRLCIARALMLEPEIILFDEPCSALDPISTFKIEELLLALKKNFTIIIVTHNIEQACRISDNIAFFYKGDVVEHGHTEDIIGSPKNELTNKYLTGRF